ncbi:MAG: tetratricopeptide repeat protein [Gemmatimonas sp.]
MNTRNALAQSYFDQGLRLYYAFNHAEAVRSFREAQRLDPACVMCFWGEALALGPNMNAPMDPAAERQAIAATERGMALLDKQKSPNDVKGEHAWMRAVASRYLGAPMQTRAQRDSAFATSMQAIATASPNDIDALAIAAEATMDLSPWNYWTRDGAPRPGTGEILASLERAMKLVPTHPGACHFYIHAVEAAHPQRAVRCAERLAALMPGAGHIVHMPAHIYIRVGRWADAIEMNKHAVHADEQYFAGPHTKDDAFYSAAYRSHNFHFLTLAAVMAGASETAVHSAAHVPDIITEDVARKIPPVEPMLAIPAQTLLTFGRFDEVLAMNMPASDLRVASSMFWYARGVAFAAKGRTVEARAAVDSIRGVMTTLPEGEPRMTLEIAVRMVEGELALRSGNAKQAVTLFTEAAGIEDGLGYMEPPTWYHPVRHSLGKALLAAGDPKGAEQVYLADLRRFPENGWSLFGLAESLRAQGLGESANAVDQRFRKAWRLADVQITSSRY